MPARVKRPPAEAEQGLEKVQVAGPEEPVLDEPALDKLIKSSTPGK